jgi:hypothetical protein
MGTACAYLTEPEESSLLVLGRGSACMCLGHHGEVRGKPSQGHFRRLTVRYERRLDMLLGLHLLAAGLICLRSLERWSC